MTSAPITRAAASRIALAAKIGVVVLTGGGIAGAILALPDIATPTHEKPTLDLPGSTPRGTTVAPVNFASVGRSLTLAAEFPPPPEIPDFDPDGGDVGPDFTPTPLTSGIPTVAFLGAVAEPNRYVALLKIDGRQKFLPPGGSFGGVRVVECTPSRVVVQVSNADGSVGERQTIELAERAGPAFAASVLPGTPAVAGEAPSPDGANPQASPMPGLPPGMTPEMMQNLSPQQIEAVRRQFEAQRAGRPGDGSQ